MQNMAKEIDEREDIIEQLECEIDDQRRKYKELFKQQMRGKPLTIQNQDKSDLQDLEAENQELRLIA